MSHHPVGEVDLSIETRRFLVDRVSLAALQVHLLETAPRWCRGLRILHDEVTGDSDPIDLERPDGLYEAVRADVFRPPGRTYRALEKAFGPGPARRAARGVWLEGNDTGLTVIVHADEFPIARVGQSWHFGNWIAIQVRTPSVEGTDSAVWVLDALVALSDVTSADYAFAASPAEYAEKNLDRSRGIRAIGRDISKYLPGLYWLNYFGPPYVELISRSRLLSPSVWRARDLGSGVLVMIHEAPGEWLTPESKRANAAALARLGAEYFFNRHDPHRATRPPDLGIPTG